MLRNPAEGKRAFGRGAIFVGLQGFDLRLRPLPLCVAQEGYKGPIHGGRASLWLEKEDGH